MCDIKKPFSVKYKKLTLDSKKSSLSFNFEFDKLVSVKLFSTKLSSVFLGVSPVVGDVKVVSLFRLLLGQATAWAAMA